MKKLPPMRVSSAESGVPGEYRVIVVDENGGEHEVFVNVAQQRARLAKPHLYATGYDRHTGDKARKAAKGHVLTVLGRAKDGQK